MKRPSRYEQAGVPVSTVTLRRELHRAGQTREAAGKVAKDWQSDGTEAPAEQPTETSTKPLN
jgi:hypothetical protein